MLTNDIVARDDMEFQELNDTLNAAISEFENNDSERARFDRVYKDILRYHPEWLFELIKNNSKFFSCMSTGTRTAYLYNDIAAYCSTNNMPVYFPGLRRGNNQKGQIYIESIAKRAEGLSDQVIGHSPQETRLITESLQKNDNEYEDNALNRHHLNLSTAIRINGHCISLASVNSIESATKMIAMLCESINGDNTVNYNSIADNVQTLLKALVNLKVFDESGLHVGAVLSKFFHMESDGDRKSSDTVSALRQILNNQGGTLQQMYAVIHKVADGDCPWRRPAETHKFYQALDRLLGETCMNVNNEDVPDRDMLPFDDPHGDFRSKM